MSVFHKKEGLNALLAPKFAKLAILAPYFGNSTFGPSSFTLFTKP